MSAAAMVEYRFDTAGPFWALYYPRTAQLTDAALLALIDEQCPGYDAAELGYLLPLADDADAARAAAARRFPGTDRAAARVVLDCHVARLYERHNPAALEAAYSADLEAAWAAAALAAGVELTADGDPVSATPEALAALDAAYDSQPLRLTPSQRAVAAARAALAPVLAVAR
jgi:hypothetical protein